MNKIFVYGTLKRGGHNNHYLKDSEFVGEGVVSGYDLYTNGGYPMIMPGGRTLHGELFLVPDEYMPDILRLESGYSIEAVEVDIGGVKHEANAFVATQRLLGAYRWKLLEDGVFKIKQHGNN